MYPLSLNALAQDRFAGAVVLGHKAQLHELGVETSENVASPWGQGGQCSLQGRQRKHGPARGLGQPRKVLPKDDDCTGEGRGRASRAGCAVR
jgi:hypothetical protein